MRFLNYKLPFFYIVFILNISVFNVLHGQQFRSYVDYGLLPKNINTDSVYTRLTSTREKAIRENDSLSVIRSLISLSAFERKNLRYGNAFSNAGESLFLAEEVKDSLLIAQAHEELGVLSYLYKQDEDAGFNFKSAHEYYKSLFKQKKIDLLDLYQSYYNLLMYYQRIEDSIQLKKHIDSCRILAKKLKFNDVNRYYLNEKRASLYEWLNNSDDAINLLKNSMMQLEGLKVNTVSTTKHRSFLIIVYGRLGSLYMDLGQFNTAKEYFEKCITTEDFTGENVFYKSFIYSKYAQLLKDQGFYKQAYENELQAKLINDTYLNPRNDKNRGFLTVKNRYKDQLSKKNILLNQQALQLAERNQEILSFRIILFVGIFLLIVIGLIVRSRIKHLKHQKKERSSQELLDIKNEELTASTLQLIEREKVIKKLSDHIKKSELDTSTKSLLKLIENRSESLWDAFNNRFISQNEGFYERLRERVPGLSSADLKTCALIKLNFSGKEMAYLLGISLGSVHVSRHRLRKKMGLDRHVNLTNFINSI